MRIVGSFFAMVVGVCSLSTRAAADDGFATVDFPTTDGVRARADVYEAKNPNATMIILFHQAGWSRGEYREIAPKLVANGYRVMAVDQRAGGAVGGVQNATHKRAVKKKLAVSYIDAYGDLVSAVEYAEQRLAAKRIVVWGSSYSASLVFRLAAERPNSIVAVMAFSPGEYFKRKGPNYVQELAKSVTTPVFVTSSKDERGMSKKISDASPSKKKVLFTPASKGQHGSRALWMKWPDHDVYWAAVNGFLSAYVPAAPPVE